MKCGISEDAKTCVSLVSELLALPLCCPGTSALSFTPTHSQSQTHTHSSYLGKIKILTLQTERERDREEGKHITKTA